MVSRIIHYWKRFLKLFEFGFKRLVVGLFGLLFSSGPVFDDDQSNIENNVEVKAFKRVLFLRFDKLGDMIVSLGTFETLANEAPDMEVEVIASPSNQVIVSDDSRVSKVWLYCKRPWRDLGVLLTLRKRNYDAIVDLICLDSVTALFVSQYLGRNVRRIGIGKSRFAKYYTHNVRINNVKLNSVSYEHMFDSTIGVLRYLGVDEERFVRQAPLALPLSSIAKSQEYFDGLQKQQKTSDSSESFVVGVNISAGQPNRKWAEKKFVELVDLLMVKHPSPSVALLCAPDDRKLAERILEAVKEQVSLIPAGLSIMDATAIIARLNMLISPDTSLIHIARQHSVPVVGMYSSHQRNTEQWKPYSQPDGVVQGSSERHIHDITAQQVFEEYVRVCERLRKVAV